MDTVKILFAFQDVDASNVFIELKRPDRKGSKNISEYISWFHVTKTSVVRLEFKSWDGKGLLREFKEGKLITTPDEKFFQRNNKDKSKIELRSLSTDSVTKSMINACINVWNN